MTAEHIGSTLLHQQSGSRADPGHRIIAELLARIGLHLECQRVELYGPTTTGSRLIGWWGTLGHEGGPDAEAAEPDPGWFPWSLGNLRPNHHLFVENAAPLRSAPHGPSLGALGFGSALYLPLGNGPDRSMGAAVCAYWTRVVADWGPPSAEPIAEWVAVALAAA